MALDELEARLNARSDAAGTEVAHAGELREEAKGLTRKVIVDRDPPGSDPRGVFAADGAGRDGKDCTGASVSLYCIHFQAFERYHWHGLPVPKVVDRRPAAFKRCTHGTLHVLCLHRNRNLLWHSEQRGVSVRDADLELDTHVLVILQVVLMSFSLTFLT
jgi:hypothetical protein